MMNEGGKVFCGNAAVHSLWQPKGGGHSGEVMEELLYHLRISVLKDMEERGDCPARTFAFKSLHHLTHATNQLEAAFSETCDIRKCGGEAPDAMGGRVNDGRFECMTIEFDSEAAREGWREFMARLKGLEDEWEHEGEGAHL